MILGMVCMILTFAIFMQMKTVEDMTSEVGISLRDKSELRDEYVRWKGLYNSLHNQLDKLEATLEKVRSDASKEDQNDVWMETEILINNKLLGLTEVQGSGIKVVLDDNREVSADEVLNISNYLVHEEDLLTIVNELFNSGADAISINGHRVTSTTSIYCAGNVIRINDEKTSVPITIYAIGYPEGMKYALERPGGYVALMRSEGVPVTIEVKDSIKIPKYSGIFKYEYITR